MAAAFEEVIGSIQQKEATILAAEGYAARVLPVARAEAVQRISEAGAYQKERVEGAKAAAEQFQHQIKAMNASKDVYQNRKYFEVLGTSLNEIRKYVIVPESAEETFIMNLEDKIAYDLLDARPDAQ